MHSFEKIDLLPRFPDIDPETADSWLIVPKDWRRPDIEGRYEILWDASRGFGQLWPRPSPGEVAAFYALEAYYTHHRESALGNPTIGPMQWAQTKLSWLFDKGAEPDKDWWSALLGNEKLRILEVGCGNGGNLSIFVSLGHEVVGVEPDPAAVEVARQRGHTVFEGMAEFLPVEVSRNRFDVVVFMHVLEHCIDPALAVRNAVSVIDPGGRFVAEVPNNDCRGARRFGELWHWLDVPRHLNFFTEKSLRALTSDNGLRVDDIVFRGYCRQFGDSWKKAQDQIADVFGAKDDRRTSDVSYWRYFLETAWSSDGEKYDSVRVVCTLS